MPTCQWIRKGGNQCKLSATKKQGMDTLFCTWHQSQQPKTLDKTTERTPTQKQILNWVSQTILEVVMTPGGGLGTIKFGIQNPSQQFKNYNEYEDWVLIKVQEVAHFGLKNDANDEDKNDHYWELINTILPMLGSDKDDCGCQSSKADELRQLVEDLQSQMQSTSN